MERGYRPPYEYEGENPVSEHDACAIIASIRKNGEATHGNLKRVLEALAKMGHRSGDVQGEGDGCGVLMDIPRRLWAATLGRAGRPTWLADDRRFFVGHLMIPYYARTETAHWKAVVRRLIETTGADILVEQDGLTRPDALGPQARAQEPLFWQIAGMMACCSLDRVEAELFDLLLAIERKTPVHVASLSNHTVVYKVRGSVETLYHYYPELRSRETTSAITIGHARYSTNTTTAFERVQPFTLLGHNGEINTINRLREQAQMLGVQLVAGGSDSQDLNRVLEFLIHHYRLTLLEAMEIVFPPTAALMESLPSNLRTIYRYFSVAFGPFAQGPAALVARYGDECVFSVDALGLRPLWFGETEKEVFFSSEKGVVPLDLLNGDPRPLAPGEKMAVLFHRNRGLTVLDFHAVQECMLDRTLKRMGRLELLHLKHPEKRRPVVHLERVPTSSLIQPTPNYLSAFGWNEDDRRWVTGLAELGKDPITSLGYDGPLAALSDTAQNLSEYFKESVAVVTNPAIDREREQELFSTQVWVGRRPTIGSIGPGSCDELPARGIMLDCPILLDGQIISQIPLSTERYREIAECEGSMLLDDLLASFETEGVARLELATEPGESVRTAVERLAHEAVEAVRCGNALLLLDDGLSFTREKGWLDPYLAAAALDAALRETWTSRNGYPVNCRRLAGIVVRTAAVRNLHDIVFLLGVGADAIAPYLLFGVAAQGGPSAASEEVANRLSKTLRGLRVGIEKVISTMGIHAVRGYGRVFSSIGLSEPLARIFRMPNYAGSAERGLTWADLDRDIARRSQCIETHDNRLPSTPRFYPRIGKWIRQVATGEVEPSAAFTAIRHVEQTTPVALRHIMGLKSQQDRAERRKVDPRDVDAGITGHRWPFVIASMSFGSQSEVAYRVYAEAAQRLNIIALNGEGGEIESIMGKYPHNRGQQIASGRFGVDIRLLNASNLLEIKIGQGAKPGEGGHLPGFKVTLPIAQARRVAPGTDLISPSNHHDIYSIEDLAQLIEELKTANPKARVAVKVPVVPGIGVIGVGIAKAGADIINLSGYDGGTGAARAHSVRYVGLPAEIGIVETHRALLESQMRQRVEIWADGGVRSPDDVVKLMCLGANRVGFGTLAMVALGCTLCRSCHTGRCRTGITTRFDLLVANGSRGECVVPLDFERAVEQLVRLFEALGEEVKALAAELGVTRLQDLVGRVDLLEQRSHFKAVDLTAMLTPKQRLTSPPTLSIGVTPLRRPRNHLTTVVSNLVMEHLVAGHPNVVFEDDRVTPVDRALGTHLAGALIRYQQGWNWPPGHCGIGGQGESWRLPTTPARCPGSTEIDDGVHLRFYASSVPGNGLGAFIGKAVSITVEGGAQDGVGKGLSGGKIVVLKGYNHDGIRIDGSVGKGLAYGATGGMIIVQGNADSRACVRLSGADVVIGGEITQPLADAEALLGARANVKGFLCEYMTAGRVLVLGDPGPWICAGMTGGVLYLRLQPEMNFDEAAIRRRIARGADVEMMQVDDTDVQNLTELLSAYAQELAQNQQQSEAKRVLALLDNWRDNFVKIVPKRRGPSESLAVQY